jgi:hypothetical protein
VDSIAAAIDDFLRQLRPLLADDGARFQTLVARDLVRQLRAEVEHAEALQTVRASTHQAFGLETSEALAEAIRAGHVEADGARRRLLAACERELRILNPRFDTRRDLP